VCEDVVFGCLKKKGGVLMLRSLSKSGGLVLGIVVCVRGHVGVLLLQYYNTFQRLLDHTAYCQQNILPSTDIKWKLIFYLYLIYSCLYYIKNNLLCEFTMS